MLIKTFATSLKEATTQDEFCGRMGGDEFIAMVEVKRTDVFLENLKNIINKVNTEETCVCNVSYSVGKAVYTNDDSVDIDTVLKIADSEMYDMKQSSNHGQKA
jgi:diguanylate cyclase (GGDEF)-like protein